MLFRRRILNFGRLDPALNDNRHTPIDEATRATDLGRSMRDAATFLRMASIEMRRIADQAPDIAVDLRVMARQLEAEADDMALQDIG